MTPHKLNDIGTQQVSNFVNEHAKERTQLAHYLQRAEVAADDAFHREMQPTLTIGLQDSTDGRWHELVLEEAWFDS